MIISSSEFLNYEIRQRWYHVAISFTGKREDRATKVLCHWREIFDLEIECPESAKSGFLSWNLPLGFLKLNIYIRNLGNSEIAYLVDTKNSKETATVLLLLSELERLPSCSRLDSKDCSKFYRSIRLEFSYIMDNGSVCCYNANIPLYRKFANRYPEFRITVPYGWRINKIKNLETENSKLIKIYNKLEGYEDELQEKNEMVEKIESELLAKHLKSDGGELIKLQRKLEQLGKKINRIENSIKKLKTPFFLFMSRDNKYQPIYLSINLITEIHSQKLEYSVKPCKNIDDLDIDENQKYSLSLNIKAKPSLVCTEIFPYFFAGISVVLLFFIWISRCAIVTDVITPTAMCLANLNIGVFSYFTYHKLSSIGYAFKNDFLIRLLFGIGFAVTIIGIILIAILHYCPDIFERCLEQIKYFFIFIIQSIFY